MGAAASIAPDAADRLSKLKLCFDHLMQTEAYRGKALAADAFDDFYGRPEHAILLLHLFNRFNLKRRDEESLMEFDSSSLVQVDVAHAKNDAEGDEDIAIVGDCNNLSNLGFLANIPPEVLPRVKCLNVSNNKLDDGAIACSNIAKHVPSLKYLIIGGNSIQSILHVSGALPFSGLRVLDLSYSEGLVFSSNCFVNSPQLQSLILDGCNIEDTIVPARIGKPAQSPNDSIFFGLISLTVLSLKENAISEEGQLRGLLFFGFDFMSSDDTISQCSKEIGLITSPFKLRNIYLEDNPIVETSAGKRSVASYLSSGIPSLRSIDGVGVGIDLSGGGGGGQTIALNKVLQRKEREHDDLDAYREKGLDNQEKEYLAALKGERDNSVVS
jgi:hypothetical protein